MVLIVRNLPGISIPVDTPRDSTGRLTTQVDDGAAPTGSSPSQKGILAMYSYAVR